MAWIRWRGPNAHLMVTVWVEGKSRQRYLGSLGGVYSVQTATRAAFEARYPDLVFDWAAIDHVLAAGPPPRHRCRPTPGIGPRWNIPSGPGRPARKGGSGSGAPWKRPQTCCENGVQDGNERSLSDMALGDIRCLHAEYDPWNG